MSKAKAILKPIRKLVRKSKPMVSDETIVHDDDDDENIEMDREEQHQNQESSFVLENDEQRPPQIVGWSKHLNIGIKSLMLLFLLTNGFILNQLQKCMCL